jgi:uncharacterized membrane protein YfcA
MLTTLIGLAALLYSSVGHAGASGYLAAMTLCGTASAALKPTALVLNLLVASLGSYKFCRAGHFRWRLLWPFALTSVPAAFVGGAMKLSDPVYRRLLGAALVLAALRLTLPSREADSEPSPPPVPAALAWGFVMGFASGLIGVGGGIFLSPLLLLAGWAGMRQTAAVSVVFILINSAAGLAGHLASLQSIPREAGAWAAAAFVGGLVGSELGSRRLPPDWLKRLLAAVLAVAASKLLLS